MNRFFSSFSFFSFFLPPQVGECTLFHTVVIYNIMYLIVC